MKALFEKIEKKEPLRVEEDQDEVEGEAGEMALVNGSEEEKMAKFKGVGEGKVGAVRRKANLSKAVQAIH